MWEMQSYKRADSGGSGKDVGREQREEKRWKGKQVLAEMGFIRFI